ncbi:ABC-2 type transport system ATP-binding protein [Deinobacterium chartae]|uniref:ABC-2 type transport system ATP-binding protein n=1 Tax=Deinobacterium chartae TaxID=521158 RepID=A0A841I6T2_9DEIO|nr:ATP-binding cassette domain-containing protein [Deinobacterium chartae]MBB6099535.1 ABC-2 type transport system ATP-binding protein [Deinobacterium chartae]
MIEARRLTREFKTKTGVVQAVQGIDFTVKDGEFVAFLGPNGAGKTTTLRMLTTLLPPTSGSAWVAGYDVVSQPTAVRQQIGYIGQGNGAGHSYQVRDELITQGRCYGMNRIDAAKRADALLETFELGDLARRTVSTLSGGQRRRLDIAMGLMHHPRLLFLDEPSTGMDPHNRANLWQHILAVRERYGTTLVLTTHYLDEADAMAERVVVIDHGRIIADDTAARLKHNLAGDRIRLTVPEAQAGRARALASGAASEVELRAASGTATLDLRVAQAEAALPQLLATLYAAGITVLTANMKQPTLDDVFLGLTGRSLREEGVRA